MINTKNKLLLWATVSLTLLIGLNSLCAAEKTNLEHVLGSLELPKVQVESSKEALSQQETAETVTPETCSAGVRQTKETLDNDCKSKNQMSLNPKSTEEQSRDPKTKKIYKKVVTIYPDRRVEEEFMEDVEVPTKTAVEDKLEKKSRGSEAAVPEVAKIESTLDSDKTEKVEATAEDSTAADKETKKKSKSSKEQKSEKKNRANDRSKRDTKGSNKSKFSRQYDSKNSKDRKHKNKSKK